MRILLVEDDVSMQATLQRALERRRIDVRVCGDGALALAQWQALEPDVVALDLSLPHVDGLQVLAAARAAGLRTPVLLLTARGTVGDRIVGLNAGADDYLPKPFALEELLDHEIRAVGLLIDIEELDDIGVIAGREGLGLPEAAVARLGQGRVVLEQELYGDAPPEERVLGLVDDTHAARTDLLDDAIVRDDATNHGRSARNLRQRLSSKSTAQTRLTSRHGQGARPFRGSRKNPSDSARR